MSTKTVGRRAVPGLGGVGESARRPDGDLKVQGRFAYASDLYAADMLWGVTVRSPHAHARVSRIDVSEAAGLAGVHAVLTHADVPGRKTYGSDAADAPVLCVDRVLYLGDPVALVAAVDPETARRAAALVWVEYDPLPPITSYDEAVEPGAAALHEGGNLIRHVPIRFGSRQPVAEVTVAGEYETGMQDQAFLGPESGLAIPDGKGGVDLHVATQWLHGDLEQTLASLALEPEQVRFHLAGVGGAFGGREDISVQIHACLLALRTGRPVKMVYARDESFVGHVHRHPARMQYEHGATRDGDLVYVKAKLMLDGGAYASSSRWVVANAAMFAAGPYRVPSATVDAFVAYTNNPPCGAMRGFGAVQAAFACESQMDRLASALAIDPLELRLRNALREGDATITGQVFSGPAPVPVMLERLRAIPLPPPRAAGDDMRTRPGATGNTTRGEGVRRGVGYALGFKNVAFSEGWDDYSTARVRLVGANGRVHVEVATAAVEVGQGLVTLVTQIARTELGLERVHVMPADSTLPPTGSSSASRQSWMTGGAVKLACEAVRLRLLDIAATTFAVPAGMLRYSGGAVMARDGQQLATVGELLGDATIEETRENHHRATQPLDPETGQGDALVALAFSAQRAVVDVDVELGLVRVVEIAATQDVGRAINPVQCEGQIEGGIAQGLGLALMEEIVVCDARILNPSFTDYLIPTSLDMPPVRIELLELAQPESPYGLNGVGEPPAIASPPAIVNALRNATRLALPRIPVSPRELAGLAESPAARSRGERSAGLLDSDFAGS